MFLLLYLDNIVIIRKPTGTTSCAKHLIHNRNALQRKHGTLNFEKRQFTHINDIGNCYRFYVLTIIFRQYCDHEKANRHYIMCKAFNPQREHGNALHNVIARSYYHI